MRIILSLLGVSLAACGATEERNATTETCMGKMKSEQGITLNHEQSKGRILLDNYACPTMQGYHHVHNVPIKKESFAEMDKRAAVEKCIMLDPETMHVQGITHGCHKRRRDYKPYFILTDVVENEETIGRVWVPVGDIMYTN